MENVIWYAGVSFLAILGILTLVLAREIIANIIGGIRGGVRMRVLWRRWEMPNPPTIGMIIRHGLANWLGSHVSTYFQIGGFKVPLDGREPLKRLPFPG